MVAALNAHQPEALTAYPSIAALLAEEQLDGRLRIAPAVVGTTSEVLSADMRRRIHDAWDVEPCDVYGTTEAAVPAAGRQGHPDHRYAVAGRPGHPTATKAGMLGSPSQGAELTDRPEPVADQTIPAVCYRHPDRPTGLRCSRCGRPICGECSNPAPVGQLCPDDARSRVRVRGLPGQERPLATLTLLGLNTLMLLVSALLTGSGFGLLEPSTQALCRLGALNAAAIAESGQWWRLLTVMVLHGGLLHWAFNSWALWVFGPTLENLLGRARFVALYVGAGFVGAAASFAFSHTQLGVGASGAIFGLLGALVAFFFRRRQAGGAVPLQNLLLVLLLNLFIASRNPQIDNVAHVGGFLAGLGAMVLLEVTPARNRGLVNAALAVPFLAGIVLTVAGIASYPVGSGLTCVGA